MKDSVKTMLLSVVMPARNEEGCIVETVTGITATLRRESIPHEIVVVNDGSTDSTESILTALSETDPAVRVITNEGRHGFGMAIRLGLDNAKGDAVTVMMADLSDSPEDLVVYYRHIQDGYECVFGSRFIKGSRVIDYPTHKLLLNRLANFIVRCLFGLRFNDVTNAFKCYRREVIEAMQPLIAPHFNLTVEMPLKAIIRGYSFKVVPISWTNRKTGVSKLKIKEMGSRYLFIMLYLWLEKHLSRGDYRRQAGLVRESTEKTTVHS
jgi:dolichol-phosphate mannosyltransferase